MARTDQRLRRFAGTEWQQKMKSEKVAAVPTIVVIKIGWLPLISDDEVEPAIAIHISQCNPATDLGLVQSHVSGHVVVPAISGPNKKRIVLVAAKIISRLKPRPTARMGHKSIVAHRQLLKLWPAIDLASQKAYCLHCFRHTIIVEIG
jgi:hypothetical protein